MRSLPIAIMLAFLAGCAAAPSQAVPQAAQRALPANLDLPRGDEGSEQARAVAQAGIPSTTPELDALVSRAARVTPTLGLDRVLAVGDGQPPPLRIRPGDEVEITVYGREEFSGVQRVAHDGRIHVFLLGGVILGGKTLEAAAVALKGQLKRSAYLKQPEVQVQMATPAPTYVRILGRVGDPGDVMMPAEPLSVLDALARVKGFLPDADGSRLSLLRRGAKGQRAYHFTYSELLDAHLAGRELWLRSRDQLVVPRLPDVYVVGFVKEPGPQPLRAGSTVSSVLALAGGLVDAADGNALVALKGTAKRSVRLADALSPGEVLFAPRRQRVYLVGAGIVDNGPLDLPRSGLTVVQAIAEAGWFSAHAKLNGVEILRYTDGKQERISVPVEEILDGERSDSEFSLRPGDLVFVPESIW